MLFNNDRYNTIFFSFIWGLGVAILFRKICKNNKCVVIHAPSNYNVENRVIQKDKRCYKLMKYNDACFK
jgi:hypothetical protein